MSKCPFELPVKPEMMRYRETDLELYRIHKLVFPYTKEEVDFICQAINCHKKFKTALERIADDNSFEPCTPIARQVLAEMNLLINF